MSEQMHTQEPWHHDATGRIWRQHPSELYENGGGVAGDHPLATVHRGYSNWENGFPLEANARRIVECVNVCAGVEQVASMRHIAEAGGFKAILERNVLNSLEYDKAIEQRDDLLEALQGLLNVLPSATTHPAIKAAREAIAKAEHPNDRT